MEENKSFQFSTIEEAWMICARARSFCVTDDPDRENEGDFICAAQFATTENVNFMATTRQGAHLHAHVRRVLCQKLAFPQMVTENTDNHETAFTVSIDHVDHHHRHLGRKSAGMTAAPCVQPGARPADFRRPGHMFPLLAKAERRAGAQRPHRGHGGPAAVWPGLRSAVCAARSCARTAP